MNFNGSKENNLDGDCCLAKKVYSRILVATNQSPTYPLKPLRLSNEKTKLIAENPLIYKAVEFPHTYVAAMAHFSLFYRITADSIIITAFWDNRQDPKKLLELLKTR